MTGCAGDIITMAYVAVAELLEHAAERLGLTQHADHYVFAHNIGRAEVQRFRRNKGFHEKLTSQTILILSPQDQRMLQAASPAARNQVLKNIAQAGIPCVMLSRSSVIPEFLSCFAEAYQVSVLISQFDEVLLESRLLNFLREKINQVTVIHGALVSIHGVGVMISGESGTGKTMCAIRLAMKGHAWIADDIINVVKNKQGILYGSSHEAVRNLIEIKNVGIMDARDLLGDQVVRDKTGIDAVVELGASEYPRNSLLNGFPGKERIILGVKLPCWNFPADHEGGESSSRRIEYAVRNFLYGELAS
jgi:HPr kinase/phosphorylase